MRACRAVVFAGCLAIAVCVCGLAGSPPDPGQPAKKPDADGLAARDPVGK